MKSFLSLTACLAALNAYAAPMYYTFTGKIGPIPQDVGGYAAAHDIRTGNTVTFVFAVDTTQPGFMLDNGVKTDKEDVDNPGYTADYYYDSLITPSLFSPAVTDLSTGSYFGFLTNTTLGTLSRRTSALQVIIGPSSGQTQVILNVSDSGTAVFMPKLNSTYAVVESYTRGTDVSSASMNLTCTAISATKPSIAIRAGRVAKASWADVAWSHDGLAVRALKGHPAVARIRDSEGRTTYVTSPGESFVIPNSALPTGPFFLQLQGQGEGERMARAFLP